MRKSIFRTKTWAGYDLDWWFLRMRRSLNKNAWADDEGIQANRRERSALIENQWNVNWTCAWNPRSSCLDRKIERVRDVSGSVLCTQKDLWWSWEISFVQRQGSWVCQMRVWT